MDIWALLAFVVVNNIFMLAAVSVGAYFVYRTKREDGYMFKATQAQDTSKAVHLDDFEPLGDAEPMPEEIFARNSRFKEQFPMGGSQ